MMQIIDLQFESFDSKASLELNCDQMEQIHEKNNIFVEDYSDIGIIVGMEQNQPTRPLLWASSSKHDLLDMPQNVKSEFGHGLHQAQMGAHPSIGKVLRGFGGASVIELVIDDHGNTFRAVYTIRFKEVVIVLHAFQKKSRSGIKTPKQDIELIHSRLKIAENMYNEWKNKRGKNG